MILLNKLFFINTIFKCGYSFKISLC